VHDFTGEVNVKQKKELYLQMFKWITSMLVEEHGFEAMEYMVKDHAHVEMMIKE
jgi:hypothetical protein